jgi:hypothetical protein
MWIIFGRLEARLFAICTVIRRFESVLASGCYGRLSTSLVGRGFITALRLSSGLWTPPLAFFIGSSPNAEMLPLYPRISRTSLVFFLPDTQANRVELIRT